VQPSFTIMELAAHEVDHVLEDKRFASLKPARCSRCGSDTGFVRRIFQIIGVEQHKQNSDETQQVLSLHFKRHHSIDFVFFKSHHGRFFVDSAVCEICKSTAIVYDVTLDGEFLSEIARVVGKSEAEVKEDLERTHKKLFLD
jgi:hypothetical protein